MLTTAAAENAPTIPSLAVIRDPDQAAALIQPDRLKLLAALTTADSSSGLSRRLGLPRQRLNYHLRELERVGLVTLVTERRRGNCVERLVQATARAYVVSPEVLGALGDTPEDARDRFSALQLVQVSARTIREVSALLDRAAASGKRLATLTLDATIRFATPTTRARFAQELTEAVASLVQKYHDDITPGGRECRLLAAAYQKPHAGTRRDATETQP